jgi:hypothetical protein
LILLAASESSPALSRHQIVLFKSVTRKPQYRKLRFVQGKGRPKPHFGTSAVANDNASSTCQKFAARAPLRRQFDVQFSGTSTKIGHSFAKSLPVPLAWVERDACATKRGSLGSPGRQYDELSADKQTDADDGG